MMYTDPPSNAPLTLAVIGLVVPVVIIWYGRKKLYLSVPCALAFFLLVAHTIPGWVKVRPVAQRISCKANLKQILRAKSEWAKENHKLIGDAPSEEDLYATNLTTGYPYLRRGLICPLGGRYTIGPIGKDPTCSFSDKGHELDR